MQQPPRTARSHAPLLPGPAAHPLFQFLQEQTGKECSWNFCKFLIGPDGQVLKCVSSPGAFLEPRAGRNVGSKHLQVLSAGSRSLQTERQNRQHNPVRVRQVIVVHVSLKCLDSDSARCSQLPRRVRDFGGSKVRPRAEDERCAIDLSCFMITIMTSIIVSSLLAVIDEENRPRRQIHGGKI